MFNWLRRNTNHLYNVRPSIDSRLFQLMEEAKTRVSHYFHIPKSSLNTFYSIMKPEIYNLGTKRFWNKSITYYEEIVGKYSPSRNWIGISSRILNSPRLLKETIYHEVVHRAQDVLGYLKKYTTRPIEQHADAWAKFLTKSNLLSSASALYH